MSELRRHPMQQLLLQSDTPCFRENAIVIYLLDEGPFDMNHLAAQPFSSQDREQFAQLIGYPLNGFAELSYVSAEALVEGGRAAELLRDPTATTPAGVEGNMQLAIFMMAKALQAIGGPEEEEILARPAVADSVRHAHAYLSKALGVDWGKFKAKLPGFPDGDTMYGRTTEDGLRVDPAKPTDDSES